MKLMKRIVFSIIILVIMCTSFGVLIKNDQSKTTVTLSFEVKSILQDDYQVFYSFDGLDWTEEHSIHQKYAKTGKWEKLSFVMPQNVQQVRIDVGKQPGIIEIKNLTISSNTSNDIVLSQLNVSLNQLKSSQLTEKQFEMTSYGNDPYFTFEIKSLIYNAIHGTNIYKLLEYLMTSGLIGLVFAIILRYLKEIFHLFKQIVHNRRLIISLARNDFKTKYASSYLGVVWGFIQPLLTIVTFWFVFQIGLRSGDISNVPFILWFVSGIVPWFFFADALSGGTNALSEYSYLVKKVVFKIELLPVVKVTSVLYVQFFFIGFIFLVFGAYGYYPSLYNLQVVYYLFCLFVLGISLTILTSSIVLFFKDLNQIIIILLQIGFWFTPIGWPITMLSGVWKTIFQLNPMFYIVQGYRDSFIDHVLFYERPVETLYFWLLCFVLLTAGVVAFRKLKPHFADVL